MDKKRKAAWKSAILNVKRGEEVSPEDHYSLLRQGMFEGLNEGDRRAEAKYVVRYWLHGARPVAYRAARAGRSG